MTTLSQTDSLSKVSYWSGALLVAGTCVGGGMLAMPVQTAGAGFPIALLVMGISWVFMSFTGLLLVEATLWLKNQTHFSSLANTLLGPVGKAISLVIYLFMNCASLVAYTAGGAALIQEWALSIFHASIGYPLACSIFTAVFGSIVYLGALLIGRINGLLTLLMIALYCYLVSVALPGLHTEFLSFRPAWREGFDSFPLILAAFSYQMIVPSLCSYLQYDPIKLRRAILIGTSIPFAVYSIWLLVIHGIVPFDGPGGLQEALVKGSAATDPLKAHFSGGWARAFADSFGFFALVTSYLGLSLALFDFVRDLFKDVWKLPAQSSVAMLSLFPSFLLALFFPRALIDFLDISGGFGDSILSGLMPVAMVWVGRYRRNWTGEFTTPGGKVSLVLAAVFALSVFILQWVKLL